MKFFIAISLILLVTSDNLKKQSLNEIKKISSNNNDENKNTESETYSKSPIITKKEFSHINTNKETFFMDFFHNYNFLNKEFYEFNLNSKELKKSVNNFLQKILYDSELFTEFYSELSNRLNKLNNGSNILMKNVNFTEKNTSKNTTTHNNIIDISSNISNITILNTNHSSKIKNPLISKSTQINLNNHENSEKLIIEKTNITESSNINNLLILNKNKKNSKLGKKNNLFVDNNNSTLLNKGKSKIELKKLNEEYESIHYNNSQSEKVNDLIELILDFPKKLYIKDIYSRNLNAQKENGNFTDYNSNINNNPLVYINDIVKSLKTEYERIYDLQSKLQNNTLNISNLYSSFLQNFSDFEAILKERSIVNTQDKYENNHLFYNSISLLLLAMLSGGMIGLIFVLTFSYKVNKDQ